MKKWLLVLAAASLLLPGAADARHRNHGAGTAGDYTADSGHNVHRPINAARRPAGATARCRDGSWSFSENHRGTCSWHGGVAEWLR